MSVFSRMAEALRRHLPDLLFGLLAAGIIIWVAWDAFEFRLVTFSPGADYWEHTAAFRALLDDPFQPSHPLIASSIGSPRFGPHTVFVALLGRILGLDALGAMGLASVLNTALFLFGIWWFFRVYFRDARASLFGLVVFFGSWLDGPHFSNVYQLGVYFSVAGYPSTTALGLSLILLTLTVLFLRAERERRGLLVALVLLFADIYITHPLTATMALPACVLMAATEPAVSMRRRLIAGGAALVGVVLTVLWPYYPALSMVVGGTAGRVQKVMAQGGQATHPFYETEMLVRIIGYCFVSLPVLGYLVWRRRHLFIALSAALMFAVFFLSAYVPIPLGHRYVLLAMPFLQMALVWLLLQLSPREARVHGPYARRWARVLSVTAVAVFLGFLTITNAVAARERFARISPSLTPRTSPTVLLGRRVAELAGADAVVLANSLASWSLPTFGPKVVTLHHRNPLITDGDERDAAMAFFSGTTSEEQRVAILERFGITHVLAPPVASRSLSRFLREHASARDVPGRHTLYAIRDASAPSPP
jgi:hypothetical protein